MELVLFALVVFLLIFGAMMLGFFFARARAKKEATIFQQYVAQQFPDLPAPAELLVTAQRSKQKGKPDIALLIADARREVVVLFDRGVEGVTHVAYPFEALGRVDSTSQMISRGVPPSRIYSYEQTMTVSFTDGRSVPFVLEFPSNKHGTDKAPGLVADIFAPWEAKLQAILRATSGTSAPAPADQAAPIPTPVASPVATVPPRPHAPVPAPAPPPATLTAPAPAPAAPAAPAAASATAPPVPPPPPPPRPSTPPPVAAPAWRADPYRRFDWRYFDGRQWTDQVSTGGQVRSDPPARVTPPEPAHH